MSPNQPSASGRFGESHTIETPEQTRLEFAVAGIGSRFLALAFDTMIQILVGIGFVIAAALVGATGILDRIPDLGLWMTAAAILLWFLLNFGYFAFFEILWNGQTPGKRRMGLRVVKESGRPLTAAESIGRNLLRIVDQVPGFYGVGIVTALLNRQNKRLGDFVAGSLVIREGSLAELRPTWPSELPAEAPPLAGADQLTVEDLALIEAFLLRRSELPANIRAQMAGNILHRLQPKLPPNPDPALSDEALLEKVAYERRARGGYVQ